MSLAEYQRSDRRLRAIQIIRQGKLSARMSRREEDPGKSRGSILAVHEIAILRRGLTRFANGESNLAFAADAQNAYRTLEAGERRTTLAFVSRPQSIYAFQVAQFRGT